jgi:hypothetical protein
MSAIHWKTDFLGRRDLYNRKEVKKWYDTAKTGCRWTCQGEQAEIVKEWVSVTGAKHRLRR